MHSNIENFLGEAALSSLDEFVSHLTYDPIAEVWNQCGCYETIELSPFANELGYYMIFHHDRDLAVSFQLPFDAAGRLAGLGRVMLETRTRHLDGRILDRATSEAIHGELAGRIMHAIPTFGRLSMNPDGPECLPNHRFLTAPRAGAELILLAPDSATQTAWRSQRLNRFEFTQKGARPRKSRPNRKG